MGKLKTRHSAKKRFRRTVSGKFVRRRAFKGHLLEKKSSKRVIARRGRCLAWVANKLGAEEAAEVKRKYNIIDDSQIPDISRFSPVSQLIGIRPGDLCRIFRPSKTAIKAEFYRVCLNK